MLFQESALFDSLTVAENVGYRLYEETDLPLDQVRARVEEVLGFIGLRDFIDRMPSELSGGQRRRVAIARAMASKPELLLFDDPTTGLDPDHRHHGGRRDRQAARSGTRDVDCRDAPDPRRVLRRHARGRARRPTAEDRATSSTSADDRAQFMVLHDGRILFEGSAAELLSSQDSYLREFLFMTLPPW